MSHIQCCTNADLEYATLRLRDHPLSLTAYGTYATGYIQLIGQHMAVVTAIVHSSPAQTGR